MVERCLEIVGQVCHSLEKGELPTPFPDNRAAFLKKTPGGQPPLEILSPEMEITVSDYYDFVIGNRFNMNHGPRSNSAASQCRADPHRQES